MILRYLLNDNAAMAKAAEQHIDAGDAAVTIEVIAEVVYVLKGIYAMARELIAETVKAFLELVTCRERAVLDCALDAYRDHSLDFVDCVLYAYHRIAGAGIATFDKKLLRLIGH